MTEKLPSEGSSEYSRRTFIAAAAGIGTAMVFDPLASWSRHQIDPNVNKIVASTIGVDTHNHIDVSLNASEALTPNVSLSEEMKRSGLSAICMTFAVDYQKLTREGEAFERFTNGLNAMDTLLKSNGINRALNFADINDAHKRNVPIVIQSVEGGHFLEGKLERLEGAYKRGLRHLGLLHDNDASVPLGDIYTKPATWGGLTEFGTNVIKECNRLGILVDLTHCSNDTINAALKVTKDPVLISHTGLDTQLGQDANFANMMKPRLISKGQAKIVADAGGVIGVWTHLASSPAEYAKNIRAMVDVVGIDHVCIGTDTKMTPPIGNNRGRPGERTNEAWKDQSTGFYYTVVASLLQIGFKEEEIGKIGGGNFCRVFNAATNGRH